MFVPEPKAPVVEFGLVEGGLLDLTSTPAHTLAGCKLGSASRGAIGLADGNLCLGTYV